uniref:Uncharacterized protein n=1 Tax=viral metagenome TaxID=1070528 RepID=A0A6C0JM46_9ZZZZ
MVMKYNIRMSFGFVFLFTLIFNISYKHIT